MEEENTFVVNVSDGRKDKKKGKTTKEAREEVLKRSKKDDNIDKSDRAAKKSFIDNVNTVKFKISGIQAKNGKLPDFAVFIKDSVHDPDVRNAAKTAGKYICLIKGNIADDFFSKIAPTADSLGTSSVRMLGTLR